VLLASARRQAEQPEPAVAELPQRLWLLALVPEEPAVLRLSPELEPVLFEPVPLELLVLLLVAAEVLRLARSRFWFARARPAAAEPPRA